jgi:hypothetical protein
MQAEGRHCDEALQRLVVTRKSSLSIGRIVHMLGDVSEVNPPVHGIYNPNVDNAIASVVERVFLVKEGGVWQPPIGDNLSNRAFHEHNIRRLRNKLTRVTPPVVVMTREQFVESYVGPLRRRYEQACDTVNYRELRGDDFYVRMFLKDEKQEVPRPGQPGKAPRAIRPMSPELNLELGRYVKPLEKALYVGLDRLFGLGSVAKGMNSNQVAASIVAKWLRLQQGSSEPVSVSTDMSRFDQHVSKPALRFVRDICVAVLQRSGVPPYSVHYFKRLWNRTMDTMNVVSLKDGKIKFRRAGTLCSGVMYTSLCGVVLTCLVLGSCARYLRIPGFTLISAGDDTNPMMPRRYVGEFVARLPAWCRQFGFSVKVDGISHAVEDIEFCRSKPFYDGVEWRMIRNVHTCLERDLMTSRLDQGEANWKKRLGAIADCGLAMNGGVPVFQSFYLMMKRAAGGLKGTLDERNSGFYRMSVGMTTAIAEPSVRSRISFHRNWGITASDQIRLEEAFDDTTLVYGGPNVNVTFYDLVFRSLYRTHG